MRVGLATLLVLMVIGSACGSSRAAVVSSPSPQPTAAPSPAPSASPSPEASPSPPYTPGPWSWPTPQPVAGTRALAITSAEASGSPTIVTMVTIDGGKVTTRQVISTSDLFVMDARGDLALVLVDQATQLALLNLQSGQIELLPVHSAGDLGGGRFSPDGSQAVIAVRNADMSSYQLDVVTIRTGAVRTLLDIPSTAYNHAGLKLLRWVSAGIMVTPGVWDLLPSQVYLLNPLTAGLTLLSQSRVEVTSPGATMLAAPNYLKLGDSEFHGQGSWPNQLFEEPIGGNPTVIAQQKNRAFYASDIADDGSLLYVVDGDLTATVPAADMGLYLYQGGQSVKVLSESWIGEWSAFFVGPAEALAVKSTLTPSGSLEIDLVGLCSAGSTCTPNVVPVLNFKADYPRASILTLD